uniref:Uncharacterized protein n=1 Tax=Pseudictyota dubia TaxID=2749911 RepID=A0A7R9Z966_9STRA
MHRPPCGNRGCPSPVRGTIVRECSLDHVAIFPPDFVESVPLAGGRINVARIFGPPRRNAKQNRLESSSASPAPSLPLPMILAALVVRGFSGRDTAAVVNVLSEEFSNVIRRGVWRLAVSVSF